MDLGSELPDFHLVGEAAVGATANIIVIISEERIITKSNEAWKRVLPPSHWWYRWRSRTSRAPGPRAEVVSLDYALESQGKPQTDKIRVSGAGLAVQLSQREPRSHGLRTAPHWLFRSFA